MSHEDLLFWLIQRQLWMMSYLFSNFLHCFVRSPHTHHVSRYREVYHGTCQQRFWDLCIWKKKCLCEVTNNIVVEYLDLIDLKGSIVGKRRKKWYNQKQFLIQLSPQFHHCYKSTLQRVDIGDHKNNQVKKHV